MNTSLVLSLQHLTCSRVVTSLFNHLEVQKNFQEKNYETIRCQVLETISRLIPCTRLQKKLEQFIDPLVREIENWLNAFQQNWYGHDSVLHAILESIPRCWLSDGTIDREKSMRALVKNKDLSPLNRFVFACTYCFFDDALDLWNILFKIEKAHLAHKSSTIVKFWIEWLESSSAKDWELFLAWSLGTPLWHSNVYMLKHALPTLSPAERSRHLLKALIGKRISNDVMRFCISVMTKDEQEQIFRESTVQVFSCMLSWPLRTIFFDMADNVWPYLTERSFCNVLNMILRTIKNQERVDMDLLIILKNLWAQSPCHFQNVARDDPYLLRPLQFILDFDVSQVFPKEKFSKSFCGVMLRRSLRIARRRYRTS
ncbi:hypothetical protein AVEN_192734-1 [Araneus ventricosus]|uniref:Uncharacterized protein n=1 Tax=Araneus ventricosus TaxID=182803 RepID=A0A4Y2KNZ0_ARAVE|nr:hypothetical protein AVEN_192734-1 [Araneus ventricosus]